MQKNGYASFNFCIRFVYFSVQCVLNFILFMVVACLIGGDGLNGKFEKGHYYVFGVASNSSGKIYTEVSKEVFHYSRLHFLNVLLTWPVCIAAAIWSKKIKAQISTLKNSA